MWMWIVGLVLIAAGVAFFFLRRSQMAKLSQVTSTQTSSCAEAAELCQSTEGHIGSAAAGAPVEVKGTIERDQALQAEMSGQECACCKSRVERRWEEERWETDSEGRRQRRVHKGRDVMSENERLEPFYVRDDTGRVLVDPQGADIDWVQSVDRFERGDPEGGTLSFGGFTFHIGGPSGAGRRTVGYHYLEWVLPVGRRVYVLGGTGMSGGEPCIQDPPGRGHRFIVSLRSEQEIVRGATRAVFWATVACVLCAGGGIVLVLLGLLRH